MRQLKKQEPKQGFWKNEKGQDVPYSYVNKSDRFKERIAFSIAKEAALIEERLKTFKQSIAQAFIDCEKAVATDYNIEQTANNAVSLTWYNFDRSIKLERKINQRFDFDDALINACKVKINEFLDDKLSGVEAFVKELINDAFQTNRGKLDPKKIMSLLKYKDKITDNRYHEAMELIEKAIFNPDSKTYYTVSIRANDGQYEAINLNFSAI
jgi:hypothetical protein